MSDFSKKLLSGQLPTDADWMEHLIEAHKIAPSMTPQAFAPHKTKEGKTFVRDSSECLDLGKSNHS
jgi:hypothetical protein